MWEVGESIDTKTIRIGPCKFKLCHFEPTYICRPQTFTVNFKMYQMWLSRQFNVLNVVLNKTTLLLALTPYYKLILSILEINVPLIIIEGLYLFNPFYLNVV